jgi:hypothetical protein
MRSHLGDFVARKHPGKMNCEVLAQMVGLGEKADNH